MDTYLIGEAAAITGSLFWSICSILFAFSSKRIGTVNVNVIRIWMALGLLSLAHLALFGYVMPQANQRQWLFLGLSGFIGLALGDFLYFGCLVALGPRRGVLVMATNPIFSAIAAYFILGEVLALWNIAGIGVTLLGVTWVVLEKEQSSEGDIAGGKNKAWGVLLGIGGSMGQGIGLVLSKYGMVNAADPGVSALNPLSATLIRIVVAGISFLLILAIWGKLGGVVKGARDRMAMGALFVGAILGPFLGVWLSMVAVTYTEAGIAATLLSLMPVMIIPIVWVLYREKTSWRGIVGAVVAIIGVAMLFLL